MTEVYPRAAGVTDAGRHRSENQDAMVLRDNVCLWAVADGMGGHHGGKWASAQIKEALESLSLTGDFDENFQRISGAVHAVNAKIVAAGEKARAVMGSTVVILYCLGSQFAIFWAGDSRVYLCRHGELVRMTADHTYTQDLVDGGLITPEEAEKHPDRNVLSRAVGANGKLTLDAMLGQTEPDDRFLLCSDGLTRVVSDSEIAAQLETAPPKDAASRLLDLVLARDAPDNVTIIAVQVDKP